MKKFLSGIAFFIGPLILIAYPLDFFISNNLAKSKTFANDSYLVWNDLYKSRIDSGIVIYGSSRAKYHINPQMLENSLHINSYNLGVEGQNFQIQYLRHKELLKYNIKPRYIILSVDVFTFQEKHRLFNPQQFLPYSFWNYNIYRSTSSYVGFSLWDYYLPMIRYIGEYGSLQNSLKSALNKDNSEAVIIKGYKGEEKEWTEDLALAQSKMKDYEIIIDPAVVDLFDNFLSECKQNNIQVILVYTPEYVEGQKFVKNRKDIIPIFQSYSSKYKIQFMDYSDDPICHEKKYFFNSLHLNKLGAETFTDVLIRDLKGPGSGLVIVKSEQ